MLKATDHRPQSDDAKRFCYKSGMPTGHVIVSRDLAPAIDADARSLETVFASMQENERSQRQ